MSVTPYSRSNYEDPILSNFDKNEFSTSQILDITESFPKHNGKITSQCHKALKIYKKLLGVQYQLNSWEFLTLKTSIDLNFNSENGGNRKFDIKVATTCIDKCNKIDRELDVLVRSMDSVKGFIGGLTIDEYISDPGCLILKIYFKLINLEQRLNETLSVSYTKSKLLIILYELTQILIKLNEETNPLVKDNTDFQSTLTSYKNFISVLISQLDDAIEQKDSEQIQECLNILNDVEKMYESVRINFEFLNEELYEFDLYSETESPKTLQYEEEVYLPKSRSRRTSISSTTSSLARHSFMGKTTLAEEMPYLLHAFDEAKHLEQELSEYQTHKPTSSPLSPTPSLSLSSSPSLSNITSPSLSSSSILSKTTKYGDKRTPTSSLSPGFTGSGMGFNNNLLNNIYGLHPKGFKSALTPHNEVD